MMTPIELADRIARLRSNRQLTERAGSLTVHAPLALAEERAEWLQLRKTPPQFIRSITITNAKSDEELTAEMVPVSGEHFRITIEKMAAPGELRLFFPGSIAGGGVEEDLATVTYVRVAGMNPADAFDTYLARFEPWLVDEMVGPPRAMELALANPRQFVRDLTGSAAVPADLRPWLRRGESRTGDLNYNAWLGLATKRVFAALADQVSKGDDATLVFGFTGPPNRSIAQTAVEPPVQVALAECLQEAGRWVYTDVRDAEARHLLLAAEWARTYNPHIDEPLSEVCRQALDSARVAYEAYVRAESRETLDALAELRKAVVEESHNTRQRAQDLASALWKDLAVASAPFVLKILADAGKASTKNAAVLSFAAAVFLFFSFVIQAVINNRFFEYQGDSRKAWEQKLGGMLSKDEVGKISGELIARSMCLYYGIRFVVGLVYAALIVALIAFGIATLHSGSTPPPPPAPAADTGGQRPASAGAGKDAGRQIRPLRQDTSARSGLP